MRRDTDTGSLTDRAISISSGYVINLGVIVLMVTLSVILAQGAVEDVSIRASEDEARAVAEYVAAEIESADGVVARGSGYGETRLRKGLTLPESRFGYSVTVRYNSTAGGTVLVSSKRSVSAVSFENSTPIQGVAGDGIELTDSSGSVIRYRPSLGKMVIE